MGVRKYEKERTHHYTGSSSGGAAGHRQCLPLFAYSGNGCRAGIPGGDRACQPADPGGREAGHFRM